MSKMLIWLEEGLEMELSFKDNAEKRAKQSAEKLTNSEIIYQHAIDKARISLDKNSLEEVIEIGAWKSIASQILIRDRGILSHARSQVWNFEQDILREKYGYY